MPESVDRRIPDGEERRVMNKAILLGRLTKDPEVRYSQSAEPMAIARYTLAVNRRTKRENEPDADFLPCVAFGKQGEFAEKYFRKGQMVGVCGRIQVRSWDDQNGQKHWQTEIIVEDQYFAESKGSSENRSYGAAEPPQGAYSGGGYGGGGSSQPAKQNQPEGFAIISENLDEEDLPF